MIHCELITKILDPPVKRPSLTVASRMRYGLLYFFNLNEFATSCPTIPLKVIVALLDINNAEVGQFPYFMDLHQCKFEVVRSLIEV